MAATLEVHLEWWYHALTLPEFWPDSNARGLEEAWRILRLLKRHHIFATFYILGQIAKMHPQLIGAIQAHGHKIGSHGYWHRHQEHEGDESDTLARRYLPWCVGYRSPFWDTTPCPGWSGGAYFRVLPYWMLKRNIEQTGVCWIHPHDLYWPGNLLPLRRMVFLCHPWERLDRLLSEVTWAR